MPLDPMIARGYQGGVANAFYGARDDAQAEQRRNALVQQSAERTRAFGLQAHQEQQQGQQKQQLMRKFAEIQSLKKLPPEAAAQWLEQQRAEPDFNQTPWANAPAEQAIPAIEQQLAVMLGIKQEDQRTAPLPASVQEYEYAQKNPGFQQYQDRNRAAAGAAPKPREPRQPSEFDLYKNMTPSERQLYDQWKGRNGGGQGGGVTIGPNGELMVNPDPSKATEGERTSSNYADRMSAAEQLLGTYSPSIQDYAAASAVMAGGPVTASIANSASSPAGRKYYQAVNDWVRAKLRKESGAAIPPDEMAQEIKTYFPLPNDDPVTIAQKAAARMQAEAGMRQMAGRAATPRQPVRPGQSAPDPQSDVANRAQSYYGR